MRTEQQKQIVVEVPEITVPVVYDLEEDVLGQCVEEYKLAETSKLIGIETETVKKRTQRGRKILLE